MKVYATIDENGRIMSTSILPLEGATEIELTEEQLFDIANYRYDNGELIYDPLPEPEPIPPQPSELEELKTYVEALSEAVDMLLMGEL